MINSQNDSYPENDHSIIIIIQWSVIKLVTLKALKNREKCEYVEFDSFYKCVLVNLDL